MQRNVMVVTGLVLVLGASAGCASGRTTSSHGAVAVAQPSEPAAPAS